MIQKDQIGPPRLEEVVQLFVGGMHGQSDIPQIKLALAKVGEIREFVEIKDKRNVNRGYAFMTVPSNSLEAFLSQDITVGDTHLFINKAQKKSDDTSLSTRIYFMKDLFNPTPLSLPKLHSHLLAFGEIVDIHIYKNHLGVSKDYGFCDFEETGPPAHLLKYKFSEMPDGSRVYYQKNKSRIKKRVLTIQRKMRKTIPSSNLGGKYCCMPSDDPT